MNWQALTTNFMTSVVNRPSKVLGFLYAKISLLLVDPCLTCSPQQSTLAHVIGTSASTHANWTDAVTDSLGSLSSVIDSPSLSQKLLLLVNEQRSCLKCCDNSDMNTHAIDYSGNSPSTSRTRWCSLPQTHPLFPLNEVIAPQIY